MQSDLNSCAAVVHVCRHESSWSGAWALVASAKSAEAAAGSRRERELVERGGRGSRTRRARAAGGETAGEGVDDKAGGSAGEGRDLWEQRRGRRPGYPRANHMAVLWYQFELVS
jgi:hypothetical protein